MACPSNGNIFSTISEEIGLFVFCDVTVKSEQSPTGILRIFACCVLKIPCGEGPTLSTVKFDDARPSFCLGLVAGLVIFGLVVVSVGPYVEFTDDDGIFTLGDKIHCKDFQVVESGVKCVCRCPVVVVELIEHVFPTVVLGVGQVLCFSA